MKKSKQKERIIKMANAVDTEIAQKLHLSVEQVQASPSIKNTYLEIKNNPNLSQGEKKDAFDEMTNIIKEMLGNK